MTGRLSVTAKGAMAAPTARITFVGRPERAALIGEDGVIGLLDLSTGRVLGILAAHPPLFYDADEGERRPGDLFAAPIISGDGSTAVAVYDLGALVYDLPSTRHRAMLVPENGRPAGGGGGHAEDSDLENEEDDEDAYIDDDDDEDLEDVDDVEDDVLLPAFARLLEATNEVAIMYSPNSRSIAGLLWSLHSGELTGELAGEAFVAVAPHPDARHWFVADEAGGLSRWDIGLRRADLVAREGASGGSAGRWASLGAGTPPEPLIDVLAVDARGRRVVALDRDGRLEAFDGGTGEPLHHVWVGTVGQWEYGRASRLVSVHPHDEHFLVAGEEELVATGMTDGEVVWSCNAPGTLTTACYLPNGEDILTIADEQILQVWSLDQCSPTGEWESEFPIGTWAVSAAGDLVVADVHGDATVLAIDGYRAAVPVDDLRRARWNA